MSDYNNEEPEISPEAQAAFNELAEVSDKIKQLMAEHGMIGSFCLVKFTEDYVTSTHDLLLEHELTRFKRVTENNTYGMMVDFVKDETEENFQKTMNKTYGTAMRLDDYLRKTTPVILGAVKYFNEMQRRADPASSLILPEHLTKDGKKIIH